MIQALSSIYDSNYYVDLENRNYIELKSTEFAHGISGKSGGSVETLTRYLQNAVSEDYREQMAEFVDLSTLDERMQDQKILSHDYLNRAGVWIRASIIPVKRNEEGKLTRILFMGHRIDHEKQKELEYQDRLLKACTEANMANRAKSDFLARMSHDIRTPINGIMGMLDIIRKTGQDPERMEDCLNKIEVSSKHLLSLVNDVLDMAKLENDSVVLSRESFCLDQICKETVDIVAFQAAEAGLQAKEEHDDISGIHIWGSPLHLKKILINLYSNSIKYNKPGGCIHTTLRILNRTEDLLVCEFQIEDSGVGMSEEFIATRLFQPFVQAESSSRSNYEGAGLGMSIVKQLIEKMGGSITVQSRLGEGSRFTVVLPFEIDRQADEEKKEETLSADLTGMHFLVAEDNELNMEIMEFFLTEKGARLDQAWNGQEAVEKFQAAEPETYDAILMDLMMPVMDGLTAARVIRALPRNDAKTIPIIAMTANAFAEDAEKCLEAGMNAHLAKPLEINKAVETIRGLVLK